MSARWPTHWCVDRLVNSPGPTRSLFPSVSPFGVEILMKSVAYTALGMGDCALAPRPVRGPVSYSAIVVSRHAFRLPVCGLVDPG